MKLKVEMADTNSEESNSSSDGTDNNTSISSYVNQRTSILVSRQRPIHTEVSQFKFASIRLWFGFDLSRSIFSSHLFLSRRLFGEHYSELLFVVC